jgi:hypothetical protein
MSVGAGVFRMKKGKRNIPTEDSESTEKNRNRMGEEDGEFAGGVGGDAESVEYRGGSAGDE